MLVRLIAKSLGIELVYRHVDGCKVGIERGQRGPGVRIVLDNVEDGVAEFVGGGADHGKGVE